MSEVLLEAKDVGKRFGGHGVLEHVGLRVRARQIVTVIGPNGSGKTTLLRLLLGLETPDSGEVRRKPGLKIGYMPQKLPVDPVFPVTAGWFLTMHSHRHRPDAAHVARVCAETGVDHLLKTPLRAVSGGELQRLMLARALLCGPELLVLDEPVQGVDVTGQAQLYDLIARVSREHHCAVLMVSHDLHLVMSATDEVICLNHHVCCAGHPQQIKEDPAFIAMFGPRVAENMAVYTHHHNHVH
jgi:zinc transport system ATP-binding protein